MSSHSTTVLTLSAGLYLVSVVVLFLLTRPAAPLAGDAARPDAWRHALASSSALAINARTGGLPFEFATEYSRLVQWVVILLMAVGANPAGTGGGIKATTFYELFRGVRRLLAGHSPGRPLGIAITWLGGYSALVLGCLLCLLATQPQMPADRLLFLAVSAASNAGLSHDPISFTQAGLYVLCVTMLLGRVAPVLVLWWMASSDQTSDVAIG